MYPIRRRERRDVTEYYCEMRLIGDGIRCDEQPPQEDCCNRIAHNFIVIYGGKQWLCAACYDGHVETRRFLHMDGENLDANGNPL
jgi:hypothetical protein